MEWTKFILFFYKEQQYIFGVCPCCGKIFQLTDCGIYFPGKHIVIDEINEVIKQGKTVQRESEKLEDLEGRVYKIQDQIENIKTEYEEQVQPLIENKYKVEGRRQALAKIEKVSKIFTKRNIDPRDIRLIFDPVEFIAFKGATVGEDISSISFVSKSPQSRRQEKILNSLANTIKNGNYAFSLIRINEDGSVEYSN